MSKYAGWRVMQMILGAVALGAFGMVVLWMPETIHPGVAGWEVDCNRLVIEKGQAKRRGMKWLNPLSSLLVLRNPNIFCVVS